MFVCSKRSKRDLFWGLHNKKGLGILGEQNRERTIHEKLDRTDSVDFSQSSSTESDPIRSSCLLIGRVPRIDNSMLV